MLSNGAKRLVSLTLRQGKQTFKDRSLLEGCTKDGEQASVFVKKFGGAATAALQNDALKGSAPGPKARFPWNPLAMGSAYSSGTAGFRSFSSSSFPASDEMSGLSHLAMLASDKENSAVTAAPSVADAAANFANLPNPLAEQVIASGSDLWATVPLISLNLPPLDATFSMSSMGMCAIFAMLTISANHNTNHLYAPAGSNVAASLRKSVMGFWNEQVKERAIRKWREVHSVSTPIPSTETTDSPTVHSNRIISNWIAAREWAGMGTLSWITSLFFVILASNTFGLIPFNEAITGKAGLTLGLSFAVWGAVTYTAIRTQGTKTVNLFLPGGIAWQMAPFFVLLEMISYSFRAISLGVRLWANMLAGHQLLHIVTGIALVPVFFKAPTLLPVSLTACGLLFAMTGLESIVCFLQSGVFCLLTSFYLAEALHKKTLLTPQPLSIKA